ncbi:Rv0909 family putative TA system antitoxin [Actinomyces timonensis]|uniref:Rv0909 family putative TA system antitoxin n=1 Tax=Actinomyces timonensis TaxID=1288391 RepID=A0AAU8N4H0_9ACTO
MGIDDLKNKAGDLADKASDALKSDKVEAVSDKVLGAAAGAAKKVTGGKFDEKIDSAVEAADSKIGNE